MLRDMLEDLEKAATLTGWSAEQRMTLEHVRNRAVTSAQHLTAAPFLMDAAVLSAERLPEHFGRDLSRALTGSREALQVIRTGQAAWWPASPAERNVMTRLSQRFTALELERIVPPFA
jgi:hypothetical protein